MSEEGDGIKIQFRIIEGEEVLKKLCISCELDMPFWIHAGNSIPQRSVGFPGVCVTTKL